MKYLVTLLAILIVNATAIGQIEFFQEETDINFTNSAFFRFNKINDDGSLSPFMFFDIAQDKGRFISNENFDLLSEKDLRLISDDDIFIRTADGIITVIDNGRIGINTSFPTEDLEIAADNILLTHKDDDDNFLEITSEQSLFIRAAGDNNDISIGNELNNVGIRTGINPVNFPFHLRSSTAVKSGSATWTVLSDTTLKKNITPYQSGLEIIRNINPIWFEYNRTEFGAEGTRYVGVSAQELQKIAPYMIKKVDYLHADKSTDKYLTYDANALPYMLINAVKEQDQIINNLIDRISRLEDLSNN